MSTSHYTAAARRKFDELRSQAEAVIAIAQAEERDLTEDELRQVTEWSAEAHSLARAIELNEQEEQRAAAVNALAAELYSGAPAGAASLGGAAPVVGGDAAGYSAVPPLMPSRAQLAEMVRMATQEQTARRWTVEGDQYRAAVTTTNTGTPVAGPNALTLPEPRRISTAAGLAVERVNGVEGVAFPVFGAGTADIAAEGATKPEYAAITPGSATPQMISVWTDFTRQTDLTVAGFEQRLRAKHAAMIAKREDLLLCTRVLATTGIQTYVAPTTSTPYGDSLLTAAGLVLSSDVAAPPDLAIVNPADLPKLFPSTGTGVLGEAPSTALRLNLHGMLVYPSTAVAAGSAIVGAWGTASRFVVGMPPTVLIDAVSQLKSNKITLLSEEAVSLAIDEPSAFVSVDLNGA
jgi:hypothetical protein